MKRLTKKQMRIFAVGQLGWSTLSGIISAWLVTFYLPTSDDMAAGARQYITPGLIIGGFLTILGLITALSRVFDAVTDPWIASLSDRSKNSVPIMEAVFSYNNILEFRLGNCKKINSLTATILDKELSALGNILLFKLMPEPLIDLILG